MRVTMTERDSDSRWEGIYMMLEAELVLELTVKIAPMQEVGEMGQGNLRIIPITGGTVFGPYIKGTVLPGGADWNTVIDDTRNHVFAKYAFQTDDGVYIAIENEGYTDKARPNAVIRTVPRFEVSRDSRYAWLLSGVFVGGLQKSTVVDSAMEIKIYKMK